MSNEPDVKPACSWTEGQIKELKGQISAVFNSDAELRRCKQFPWLTGYLGNPLSGVWFVGENPSLQQAERVDQEYPTANEEKQWYISQGDILFRTSLVGNGFKEGSWDSPGGWNCYITDIVKSAHQAKEWNKKSQENDTA